MKKSVFLFSGQGSQYYQMGKSLFDQNVVFRAEMEEMDEIARGVIGVSVLSKMYDSRNSKVDPFVDTRLSHPALFMLGYALAKALIDFGLSPSLLCGSSLGEFTALAVSGAIGRDDAVRSVCRQAQSIHECCPDGYMIAILDKISCLDDCKGVFDSMEIAAVNHESHFVISIPLQSRHGIINYLKTRGVIHQELPVSKAFHSQWIDPARDAILNHSREMSFQKVGIPVISCVDGKVLESITEDHLWNAVRGPIQFPIALHSIEAAGPCAYYDCGPSGTLSGLGRRLVDGRSLSTFFSPITPFESDSIDYCRIWGAFPVTATSESFVEKEYQIKKKERSMQACLFPGQGSQQIGMGEGLFEEFPDLTAKADAILGYSIKKLCLEDPDHCLGKTQFTQPALYFVNALAYLHKVRNEGFSPDFFVGHSLGEYDALFAAGVIDFEWGLKLVQKRGALMALAKNGGMAAVIGLGEDRIREILQSHNLVGVEIANLNSPTQIVLSGLSNDIEAAQGVFEAEGCRMYVTLKVSGAFHSKYMSEARTEFGQFLENVPLFSPRKPVISNVKARAYPSDVQSVRGILADQINNPVRWTESIRVLMGMGCESFVEVGPGNVLTGLVNKIRKESSPLLLDKNSASGNKDGVVLERHLEMMEVQKAGSSILSSKNPEKGEYRSGFNSASLGCSEFRKEYNLKYSYVTGGMYRGIASPQMVIKMGMSGMLGFLGTGGLGLDEVAKSIDIIQSHLNSDQPYGLNFLHNPHSSDLEEKTIDLFVKKGVRHIEAAAFMGVTPALVRFRVSGFERMPDGSVKNDRTIIAKISRPEVAEVFLNPPPERILERLLAEGKISSFQAESSRSLPMVDDLCVEADSGGHTDQGVLFALLPAVISLRNEIQKKYAYKKKIRVGAAGGIGSPSAAAAAFLLGADFILTGSINQCTVEAGTSDLVKEMLQDINVQDTDYAPAGDMFEMGAKVQVLRRGVFFAARANKLYDLYKQFDSLDQIDSKTRLQIEEKYFRCSFDDIYAESRKYFQNVNPEMIEKADKNPKQKMALVFRWYFGATTRFAMAGQADRKVDFQIHCGPALGSFNQWVKGTNLESWQNRHVDDIALRIMDGAAGVVDDFFRRCN